jgi:predicted ATPase/class 3 adenylate cyclase
MDSSSQALPAGTVTFLFTDIEGSTQLWEKYPDAMKAALARHDSILKRAVESNAGHLIKSVGDGMLAVFETAGQGLAATLTAQRALAEDAWEEIKPQAVRVRMGLHTGEAELRDADYFGSTLNRAARIMAAGHGGQVLLSAVTAELVRRELPPEVALVDMGEQHLKGLLLAEHIYQVNAPALAHDFPALNSLSKPNHNLPPQLTSFIGRETELRETQEKLESARLLTLIGPGGTGKTRLALELAATQLDRFRDGVWLVELAPISDPALIVSSVASVFGIREAPGVPLISLVTDYLHAKELLLVLDNCEHLVEGSARVADQLLRACAKLKIIASSREALAVDGETVYRVPSLSLPEHADGDLTKYEATRLFMERAAKAEPRFRATAENSEAIVQICRRLDGIPLAIELAAARVKVFTPQQIAERLDDRFKLLTGGSRTALPRQQTLRALIDWSYQSLDEVEQRALRRLAVFSGGWTIEGAEAVIDDAEALDGLLGLVNKSLVNVSEQSGAARYRFLETIRQYAMEKLLESDEATATRDRQLDYVIELAGDVDVGVMGTRNIAWLNKMEVEHDNLRAALEWASTRDVRKGIRLALTLGGFWTSRDYNTEAEAWCQTILSRSEGLADVASARARLYGVLAQAAIFMGDHKVAHPAALGGLKVAEEANDEVARVRLLALRGLSSMYLADFADASEALRSADALARERGLTAELSMIMTLKTQVMYFSGGDMNETKDSLGELESLTIQGESQWSSPMLGFAYARLTGLLGNIEKARVLYKKAADDARELGNMRLVFSCHSELAHILRRHGDLDEALGLYAEVLPHWRDIGHRSAMAHELECIAFILAQKDGAETAVKLLAAAESLRASIDSKMSPKEQVEYDQALAGLHTRVDEAGFEELWNAGRSMDADQAVDLALSAARTSP